MSAISAKHCCVGPVIFRRNEAIEFLAGGSHSDFGVMAPPGFRHIGVNPGPGPGISDQWSTATHLGLSPMRRGRRWHTVNPRYFNFDDPGAPAPGRHRSGDCPKRVDGTAQDRRLSSPRQDFLVEDPPISPVGDHLTGSLAEPKVGVLTCPFSCWQVCVL